MLNLRIIYILMACILTTQWLNVDQQLNSISLFSLAYGHFIGLPVIETKSVGNYKIVFQPYPSVPLLGDNSTQLNFSILDKDNQNINIIFSSLVIKQKETGDIVKVFPFRVYEFSDMTFPYTFVNTGNYVLSLQSKINGDPVYAEKPLVVDFDLSIEDGTKGMPFNELVLYYITPGIIIITAIAVYLRRKNKI
jgi:hypothetical protein